MGKAESHATLERIVITKSIPSRGSDHLPVDFDAVVVLEGGQHQLVRLQQLKLLEERRFLLAQVIPLSWPPGIVELQPDIAGAWAVIFRCRGSEIPCESERTHVRQPLASDILLCSDDTVLATRSVSSKSRIRPNREDSMKLDTDEATNGAVR